MHDYEDMKKKCAELLSKNDDLKKENEQLNKENTDLQESSIKYYNELKELKSSMSKISYEKDHMELKLLEYEDTIKKLEEKIKRYQDSDKTYEWIEQGAELNNIKEVLKDKNKYIEELQVSHNIIEQENSELIFSNEELIKALKILTNLLPIRI